MRIKLKGLLACCILSIFCQPALSQNSDSLEMYTLWSGGAIPKSADLQELSHVRFRTIKKFEPEVDGYRFLHGLTIDRYHKRWVATFGHNKGPENTGTEEAQSTFSKNLRKWSKVNTIANPKGDLAVSHGVLLVHKDTLWSFNGSFNGIMKSLHTRAYTWDEAAGKWIFQGIVAAGNFWPLQQPQQMANGEWIMAGAVIGGKNPPAVAICKNGDFRHWEIHKVTTPVSVWGESSVIIDGAEVLLISRSAGNTPKFEGHSHPLAWVAHSSDYGHSWSELQPSNLPMAASKPYAGTLSTGQRYLIGSSSADSKNARNPLTIAVSKAGEKTFSKIYCIRRAVHKKGKVESSPKASLAYPYAIEHKGKLYVVYSNSGGRTGNGRAYWNNNSAELAIIPIKELQVP